MIHWWTHLSISHSGAVIGTVLVVAWLLLEIVRGMP